MVSEPQKAIRLRAQTRVRRGPAESETPGMQRNSKRENRETPSSSARQFGADRRENAMSGKSLMHGGGESSDCIVPTKCANKGGETPAERTEGRQYMPHLRGQLHRLWVLCTPPT